MRYPSLLQAIILIALVGLLQVIAGLALTVLFPATNPTSLHPLALAVANLVAFGVVIAGGALRSGTGFGEVLRLTRVSPGILVPVAALMVGSSVLLSDIDNLTRLYFPPPAEFIEIMQNLLDSAEPLSPFFLVVVVAPVTEEVLFRGLILRGFLANYSPRKAILLSALLFAVIHANPWQLVPAFVAGILLAWLAVETRSLIPCLFAHALVNGMALSAGYLPVDIPGFSHAGGSVPVEFQPLWLNALGVLLLLAGYLHLRRGFRRAADSDTGSRS